MKANFTLEEPIEEFEYPEFPVLSLSINEVRRLEAFIRNYDNRFTMDDIKFKLEDYLTKVDKFV